VKHYIDLKVEAAQLNGSLNSWSSYPRRHRQGVWMWCGTLWLDLLPYAFVRPILIQMKVKDWSWENHSPILSLSKMRVAVDVDLVACLNRVVFGCHLSVESRIEALLKVSKFPGDRSPSSQPSRTVNI
jgi:hypothetical protein